MYITIDDIKGEKMIDLFHPSHSLNTRKEITVISLFSDNIQCDSFLLFHQAMGN